MPQPSLKTPDIRRAVRLVETMLRRGYGQPKNGNNQRKQAIRAAGDEAKRRGWCRASDGNAWIRHRIRAGDDRGIEVDWTIRPKPRPVKRKQRATVETKREPPPIIKTERALVIPDIHLCPTHPDVTRMEWLGRHASEIAPDWIIQLGDLMTADSVSGHAPPGTISFEKNPRIKADFEHLERGLERFNRGALRCRARRHQTMGNHEQRFERFEDRNPQCQGVFTERYLDAMNKAGWGVTEFGKYFYVQGVGFIHIPLNPMGRPYGGKTAPGRIANDSTFSIVHGHTHQYHSVSAAKMDGRQVRVISAGCALPEDYIEPYAKHSLTGWRWGCLELTIRNGAIIDEAFVSMHTLRQRYSGVSRSR